MMQAMIQAMFHLQTPLLEKIVRPIIVYFFLILLLRVFGKRELAQLNPFDLIVLLSLSNVVQNALIGNDNSVSGGVIGAASLLTINWLVVRFLYSSPKLERVIGGSELTLVRDGVIDHKALRKELLTKEELLAAIHRQGFDSVRDVMKCVLAPNGSFYVEGRKPSSAEEQHTDLVARLDGIQRDLQQLRKQLPIAE